MWPQKIEAVGFGPKKVLAERYAAAAVCQKLKASTALSTCAIKMACPALRGTVDRVNYVQYVA